MYSYFTPGEGNRATKSEEVLTTQKKVANLVAGINTPAATDPNISYAEFEEGNRPLNSDGKKEVWRKICNLLQG